jgi:hypothetical protein
MIKFQPRDMTMEGKITALGSVAKQSDIEVFYFIGSRLLQNVDTYLPNISEDQT